MNTSTIIQKLWNYCNVLGDDGMSYGDYVEQLYDLRTNKHFTLKTAPLRREDLDEFVACFQPDNRHDRKPTWWPAIPDGRFRTYDYEELASRDKASLNIFWLKDESLADSDNLVPPDVIAQEIVQDLEAALEQFRLIAGDLGGQNGEAS